MDRTAINPWPWSLQMGFSQGERIENFKRIMMCAGQTSVDAEGTPQHPGDMEAQMRLALDNLEAVLSGAGMRLANLVRLNFYTVDIEAFFAASHVMGGAVGRRRRHAAGHPAGDQAARLSRAHDRDGGHSRGLRAAGTAS